MSLFSFLKNAGSKIFAPTTIASKTTPTTETVDVEAAKRAAAVASRQKLIVLKGVVNSLRLDVEDLDIDYKDDTVTVYGSVNAQTDKEKIILALGNVAGVAAVDDRMTVENPEPEAVFL